MAHHPLNLAVRLALELTALAALGAWAWASASDGWRLVAALAIPALAATAWATFAVPDDPSRSGDAPVVVAGAVRLALELAVFALAAWALFALGRAEFGAVFVTVLGLHHLASLERIEWLLAR